MHLPILVLNAVLLAVGQQSSPPVASSVTVHNCLVTMIDEAQVAAQEPGILTELKVREGQQMAAGELMAQIDDAKTQMELRVADAKRRMKQEEANNDIGVRYTTAAAKVAGATYEKNMEANRRVPGTVPQVEIHRLWLEWQKEVLSIEKAEMDRRVAKLDHDVSLEEVKAAEENLRRRQIRAPMDSVVIELKRHPGEWVQPGDPVMHVIRVDRLRIEGFLNVNQVLHSQISMEKDQVVVTVPLAGGRKVTFPGTVVFVNPQVQAGGEYQFFVEVDNRKESGAWVLNPGLTAEITLRLK